MIVAIAPAGTGIVAREEFREGTSVGAAIAAFCDSYTPPLNPADYMGVDVGAEVPGLSGPGKVWLVDRDAVQLVEADLDLTADVKARLLADPLEDVAVSVSASGLTATVDAPSIGIESDESTVVADPAETKYLLISVIYDQTGDAFEVAAREKTTGEYADLAADELLVKDLQEYSVVAQGTELVEV